MSSHRKDRLSLGDHHLATRHRAGRIQPDPPPQRVGRVPQRSPDSCSSRRSNCAGTSSASPPCAASCRLAAKSPGTTASSPRTGLDVTLDDLFGDHDTLVIYSYMFGPERDGPCPMCTSLMGGLDHKIHDIHQRAAIAFTARSPIERLVDAKKSRGWVDLPVFSDRSGDYTRDYVHPDDADLPAYNVFTRRDGVVRHFWGDEITDAMADPGEDPRVPCSSTRCGCSSTRCPTAAAPIGTRASPTDRLPCFWGRSSRCAQRSAPRTLADALADRTWPAVGERADLGDDRVEVRAGDRSCAIDGRPHRREVLRRCAAAAADDAGAGVDGERGVARHQLGGAGVHDLGALEVGDAAVALADRRRTSGRRQSSRAARRGCRGRPTPQLAP